MFPAVSQGHIWIMDLAAWLAPRNVSRRRTIHVEVLRLWLWVPGDPAHGRWNNGSTQRIDDDQWFSSTNGTNQGLRFGDSWCLPLLNVPPRESTPSVRFFPFFKLPSSANQSASAIPSCDHFPWPSVRRGTRTWENHMFWLGALKISHSTSRT